MKLFELSGADENIRFSPFVIRIKMALKHKEIDFHAVPIKFTDKSPIEPSGSKQFRLLKIMGNGLRKAGILLVILKTNTKKHLLYLEVI